MMVQACIIYYGGFAIVKALMPGGICHAGQSGLVSVCLCIDYCDFEFCRLFS